jgi:hypothetical protein
MAMGRKRAPWHSEHPAAQAIIAACEEARRKDPILMRLLAELKAAQADQDRERRQKIKAEIAKIRAEVFKLRASIRPRIKALNNQILRLQIQYRTPTYPVNAWRKVAARQLQLDKRAGEKLVRQQRQELHRRYKRYLQHESH